MAISMPASLMLVKASRFAFMSISAPLKAQDRPMTKSRNTTVTDRDDNFTKGAKSEKQESMTGVLGFL